MQNIGKWFVRRLKERSTYVGIATVAAALGLPEVAAHIGNAGQVAAIVFGTGLATATTSQHPDAFELAQRL